MAETMGGGRTYVHLTATNGKHETRLLKEARTALRSGVFQAVRIVAKKGRGDDALPLTETIEDGITLTRIPVRRVLPGVTSALWFGAALMHCVRVRPAVISVHHVVLLPLGCMVKWMTGARLIYDAHELETESASLVGRPWQKAVLKLLERLLVRVCDHTLVVGEGIAAWYRRSYPQTKVTAIHNFPPRAPATAPSDGRLRRELGIAPDKTIFIYQGVLEEDRGIPLLLKVFTDGLVPDGVFVAMGYGSLDERIAAAAAQSPSVCYQPAVPPSEIISWTRTADVGLVLAPAPCLSYRLSLPNKLFEYIQANIPVLVSAELEEMSAMVASRKIGRSTELTVEQVAAALNSFSREYIASLKANVALAASELHWENEDSRLTAVYREIVGQKPQSPGRDDPQRRGR